VSPLPGSKVIPLRWSRYHALVAVGGMNAKCRIYNPDLDESGWDAATESGTLQRGAAVYDGPCRIQAVRSEAGTVQADESVTSRQYLVQVLFEAPDVEEKWQVVPYAVINDAHLEGIPLTVNDVQHGSERFTRDLVCTHNQN